jgi:DNA-binding MltR family transcriptional regulator
MDVAAAKITEGLLGIRKRTHAQTVIVGAAILEQTLLDALIAKMQPLSKTLKDRLFEGYGPLNSFSSKVDLSYALHIITKDIYDDLTTIRKIRNAFAHSVSLINFDSREIRALFKRFTTMPVGETDYSKYYMSKLVDIDRHLNDFIAATTGAWDKLLSRLP